MYLSIFTIILLILFAPIVVEAIKLMIGIFTVFIVLPILVGIGCFFGANDPDSFLNKWWKKRQEKKGLI